MYKNQTLRHKALGVTFGRLARSIGFLPLSDLARWEYGNRKYVSWFTHGGINISR